MRKKLISSGSEFEKKAAYSRAVVMGDFIFVSGTTGFDYQTMTIEDDIVAQTEQCFLNIIRALEQAGSSIDDVVRITYIIPNAEEFPLCYPMLQKYLKYVRPAATMISAGLADKRMKIEIEVTAYKQGL